MAYSSRSVKFMKTISLILDIGTVVLSHRLKHEVQKAGLSFGEFLMCNVHKLFHLYERRNCCKCIHTQQRTSVLSEHQWAILFKNTAKPCKEKKRPCLCRIEPQSDVSEDDLDLSLLSLLLQNACSLQDVELQDIKTLREKRNHFLHEKNASIEDDVFQREFSSIRSTIESIANQCGKDVFTSVTKDIENLTKSQLNDNMCRHVLSQLYYMEETTGEKLSHLCEDMELLKIYLKKLSNGNHQTILCDERNLPPLRSGDYTEHGFVESSKGAASCEMNTDHEKSCNHKQKLQPATQKINTPLLHISTENGDFEMTKILLEKSPNKVNDVDDRGWTAAHIAAEKGDLRILQLLLRKGVDATGSTDAKFTTLHIACLNAKYEMCHFLLSNFPALINVVDNRGWNAAHFAAQGGDFHILQLLAEQGVSITGTTKDKCTILHISCSNGKYEMSQYILSKYPEMIDNVNEFGWRAVHYAAEGGNIRILQLLIDKGVSLNIATDNKETLLHIACLSSRYDICQYLLSNCPDNLQDVDERGWNAIHFAAQGGDVRILKLLADRMLSLKETTFDKCTILHISCSNAKYDMCKHILQVLPEILHDVNEWGWNAAHYAAEGGNVQILNLLSENGLEI